MSSVNNMAGYRLSPRQKRSWLLNGGTQHSTMCVDALISIQGPLDKLKLKTAWRTLFARHDILRTRLVPLPGIAVPLQTVSDSFCGDLEFCELGNELVEQAFTTFQNRSYNVLSQSPLEGRVYSVTDQSHVLMIRIPTIFGDHHNVGLIMAELAALYDKEDLDEHVIQFLSFVEWHAEALGSEESEVGREYWREIPVDRLLKPLSTKELMPIGTYEADIPSDLLERLNELAEKHAYSLPALLLASQMLLVSRYQDWDQVLFGTGFDGRFDVDLSQALGPYWEFLPVVAQPNPQHSFNYFWANLERQLEEVFDWRECFSWDSLYGKDTQARPFAYGFNYIALPEIIKTRDRVWHCKSLRSTYEPMDLLLVVCLGEDGLNLSWYFDTSEYDQDSVMRMHRRFIHLLEEVQRDESKSIGDLDILPKDECKFLLTTLNDTDRLRQGSQFLHKRFSIVAQLYPQYPALFFEERELTYAELDARTDEVAHYLIEHGLRPETLVGICVDRSPEMIYGILGVLKAGGSYLPLDPDYPADRLEMVLCDALPPFLLTRRPLKQRIPAYHGALVFLDEIPPTSISITLPDEPLTEDQIAYIIYTSGSTGRPKGVAVSHKSICNRVMWAVEQFGIGTQDRFLQRTSFSFDASIWEIFAPLVSGGTLVLTRANDNHDSYYLNQLIKARKVTLAQFVPSLLSNLMADNGLDGCSSLRRVFCGGEALSRDLQDRFFATLNSGLQNLYGPTEVAIDATSFSCDPGNERVFIGKPLCNVRLYITTKSMQPVPFGFNGELLVGGVGVARGYFRRPALTAERFVPDPYSGVPGARLYRTGDRVRYYSDGNIAYEGRLDLQVKLRGYRIEPGEIESQLMAIKGIEKAKVLIREDTPGLMHLVGYVVVDEPSNFNSADVQGVLGEFLPDFMVPNFIVPVDRFPLTPNGKLDEKKLPAPAVFFDGEQQVKPRNLLESKLAELWCEVLRVPSIGIHDNFFALGGHSLLSTQIIARARKTFQLDLSLRALFDFPTIAQLAQEIAARQVDAIELAPLVASKRGEMIPLSFAQNRMWFLEQLEGANPNYSIPMALSLAGTLDMDALKKSFNHIRARHEVLRTTFKSVDGSPVQVIEPEAKLEPEIISIEHLSAEAQVVEVERQIAANVAHLFNLETGPLLKVSILCLSPSKHVLLVNMHHIISDGWSIGILINEVAHCYDAYSRGKKPELPDLPIQYADYAIWQGENLKGEAMAQQVAFWRENLDGLPPLLELPTDRPRPSYLSREGAAYSFYIPEAIKQSVVALSDAHGATLFMTLLSAFQVLLSRYSGQDDVAVGSPNANRTRKETEGLIGFFVNMLVYRANLNNNPSFEEFLQSTRENALAVYAHQDVPFEQLVELLQPQRSLSHTPLFQVVFALQNVPIEPLLLEGLELAPLHQETIFAKFDLAIFVTEIDGGIQASVEYNTTLFDQATIRRLTQNYLVLLQEIVASPYAPVKNLRLLTDEERERAMHTWNQTEQILPVHNWIHEPFNAQATANPRRIALMQRDHELTYGELQQMAWQLAHELQRRGVTSNSLVGVRLDRGFYQVAATLAITFAGAAYLPLSTSWPEKRCATVLKEGGVKILLSECPVIEAEQVDYIAPSLFFLSNPLKVTLPSCLATSNDLAYVIFTSGSTGRPKGVVIQHKAALNTLHDVNQHFSVNENDSILGVSSLTFDLSVYDLHGMLAAGGRLVIPEEGKAQDPAHWAELLEKHGITMWNSVPALMQLLIDHLERYPGIDASSLRVSLMSGDWIPVSLPDRMRARIPGIRPISLGGATEASIWSISYPIGEVDPTWKSIPYGRPMANQHFYVLSEGGEPCPIGSPGYLYIGGVGLAKGYWGDPDKTASSFVNHPLTGTPLYKTGDLGRYMNEEGLIEFLGRSDFQVKVNGYRVELGEIEVVLCQCPNVRDAIVISRKGKKAENSLVAFLSTYSGELDQEGLTAYLKDRLPDYMVPQSMVYVQTMPVNANGKVDREALLDLAIEDSKLPFLLPRTKMEKRVAGLFSDLLEVTQVGVQDNFFALGGHSLLATQAVSRLRHSLNIELPIRALFEMPTVEVLAAHLERKASQSGNQQMDAYSSIAAVERPENLPLSFAQRRLWFLNRLEKNHDAYNISFALRLQGALSETAVKQSVESIVMRHESLRTSFSMHEDNPVQVISKHVSDAFICIDLEKLVVMDADFDKEKAIKQLAQKNAGHHFNLEQAPLFKVTLVRVSVQDYVLLICMHHIISDAWSMGVLIEEFSRAYNAFAQGLALSLEPLPVQYADFALWQQQPGLFEDQLQWWEQQLDGLPECVSLPTDHPRSAGGFNGSGSVTEILSANITQRLKLLAQDANASLFMVLLTLFKVLIYRYSGDNDFAVGTPIANRNRSEVESLIGFFVNTLVIRSKLNEKTTFKDFLNEVKTCTLDAYQHQDIPFERVVDRLNPSRNPHVSPLFQVMFMLQNVPLEQLVLHNLNVLQVADGHRVARFDLTLCVEERLDSLFATMDFNTRLFEQDTIKQFMSNFIRLAELVTEDPNLPVTHYAVLNDQDLLGSFDPYAWDEWSPIHQWIDEQGVALGDKKALYYMKESISFRDLSVHSSQIAHAILKLGVGKGQLVAILLDETPQSVLSMLAVMKAGAAFSCLDITSPLFRNEDILKDLVPDLLISSETILDNSGIAKEKLNYPLLLLGDSISEQFAGMDKQAPSIALSPDDPVYVVFTSGSTGKPKGIVQRHRGLSQFCLWDHQTFNDGIERQAIWNRTNYDAYYHNLFSVICFGRVGYTATHECRYHPERMIDWIVEERIEKICVVPNFCKQMLDVLEERQQHLPDLKILMLAGEIFQVALARRLQTHLPSLRVYNMYGPSEAILATYHMVEPVTDKTYAIPLGKAIGGRQILVLDVNDNLCLVGAVGEICIRSRYLTLGYHKQENVTERVFVTNPLTGDPADKIYRTGDLGRRMADGTHRFVGRKDNQIKLRGMRLELEEVEKAIVSLPQVSEVLVSTFEVDGDIRLVAYVALFEEINQHNLRESLRKLMPTWMIPSRFMIMDKLPRNANNKLDRKALPKISEMPVEMDVAKPSNETELNVHNHWCQLLGLSVSGINTNFFDLGGHSLLATSLISRLNAYYLCSIPLQAFFAKPTIAGLAEVIDGLVAKNSEDQMLEGMVANLEDMTDEEVLALLAAEDDVDKSVGGRA